MLDNNKKLLKLVQEVHQRLLASKIKVSFAESCTGGLLQKLITDTSGSSSYFEGGFVTYSNRLKNKILGVKEETLTKYGAVSSQCAKEMVEGVNRITGADISVSVTGIAGPTGGSLDKPVGTVCFGFLSQQGLTTQVKCFKGSRDDVRHQSAIFVLESILELLSK